jgi:hypothetical protein
MGSRSSRVKAPPARTTSDACRRCWPVASGWSTTGRCDLSSRHWNAGPAKAASKYPTRSTMPLTTTLLVRLPVPSSRRCRWTMALIRYRYGWPSTTIPPDWPRIARQRCSGSPLAHREAVSASVAADHHSGRAIRSRNRPPVQAVLRSGLKRLDNRTLVGPAAEQFAEHPCVPSATTNKNRKDDASLLSRNSHE